MTDSTATDTGQARPGRRPLRVRLPRRPATRAVLLVVLVAVLAVVVDLVVLTQRVDRLDVDLGGGAGDADGRTWVLVGLDSRVDLPAGAHVADFGTAEDVPGSRADVVVVVHQTDQGTTLLSVPRDVVVRSDGHPGRLALSWLDGPEATVEALCGLGIPTDHLISIDLAGFAAVVDAAGGLDVDVPAPVRDQPAGLLLEQGGRQHLDGATALALVRSRHPEQLVDGQWVPAPVDPDGRAGHAGMVLEALADAVTGSWSRPWRLQQVAWATSAALTVDDGTSMTDLTGLLGADLGAVTVLPVSDPAGEAILRFPTDATAQTLAAAGLSCDG